jgi:hypothetical protein
MNRKSYYIKAKRKLNIYLMGKTMALLYVSIHYKGRSSHALTRSWGQDSLHWNDFMYP